MGKAGASAVKAGAAYVELGADDAKLRSALKGAKASMTRFAADIGSLGKKLALAGVAMVAPIIIAIKKTGDYQEILSKFRAVFKEHSTQAEAWSMAFSESIGRARVDVLSYMAAMQDTFVPLGFARDRAMELAKAVTTLAIDMASFNNAVDEDVLRGLQSALVGNHETVRRYGVIITQATLDQELLSMGIEKGVKSATNQQKVMARLNIIMKGTTDAQGDAIRTAGSFANQVKRLRASLSNLLVTLGAHLIPKVTEWVKVANGWVKTSEKWIQNNKGVIVTYVKLAATIITVGATLWALGKTIGIVMYTLTPAGALGLAIAGVIALLDALGFVNIGFMDFLQNVRLGSFKISTWMQTAGKEMVKQWFIAESALIGIWDFLVVAAKTFGHTLFRMLIWVPEKILEGFDWMVRQVVDKLNWLVEQSNKILPKFLEIEKLLPPKLAKDAAKFLKDLSKNSADAAGKEWDKFEKRRQVRAKETQGVISSIQAAQMKMFSMDITEFKKITSAAAKAAAPAIPGMPAMPTMPTVPTTAEGPTTEIVGTFAGRRASQMAGAGTLERESLNTEKLMARLLAIIANNTREGGMVLG